MGSIGERRSSIERKFEELFSKKKFEEQCTEETLEKLHEAFLAAENEQMDKSQLQNAFQTVLKIHIQDEEMHILFKKINLRRNGFVSWDEFVSHILLEFQEKDASLQRETLEPPLAGMPLVLRTHHRCPISRIIFCPEVFPDRTSSFLRGYYMTVSKDGIINYWSLDLVYQRSVQSTNPFLRVRPTFITDFIAMPDIQIVCTSSTERDLRFYDTVAKKFDLRVIITSFKSAVVCMSYYFSVDIAEESFIILGDTNGSVIVMSFSAVQKGPFKHTSDRDVSHHHYDSVLNGSLKGLKVREFKNIHSNWVSQVAYSCTLRAFISCSRCTECSLIISDPTGTKMKYTFSVLSGITCFTFCEESQLLATGGPDCTVRLWNPFVPKKASMTLIGHRAAICAIIVQNEEKRLYTVAKDRSIKIWDIVGQSCIQTYNNLPSDLGEHTDMSVLYNTITHKMIIASMTIAVVVCERVINQEITDGLTHNRPVSCVLYNSLFKVIISTGHDSCIITWDPWTGRRLFLVKNAHSSSWFGQLVPIEITASCFDTSEQLLLTGARNGSLKMWNFNTGTCIRNMAIEGNCEITSVVWLKNRILCTGWNRHVTEFADTDKGVEIKDWDSRHTEDILCAAVKYPDALATASYNGEIVLWRLETGQPYRRYQVNDPTQRYTIVYKKESKDRYNRVSLKTSVKRMKTDKRSSVKINESSPSVIIRNENSMMQETAAGITRTVPVRAIIFLMARPLASNIGSLLVSLESGIIQVWSHHAAAGFLIAFSVVHTRSDYALSLTTDTDNDFLITGHAVGYIKVWLLKNYALPNPPKISIPLLRLEFPFMSKDRIDGRAKRAIKDQPLPILLSSMQAHTKAINSLQYISSARIIISGSSDNTVRLWTLNGRYISTLGTFRPWSTLLPDTPAISYFTNYRIPPDVKRIASFTTTKVLNGGSMEEKIEGETEELADAAIEVPEEERKLLYGTRVSAKIFEEYYKRPEKTNVYEDTPILDSSLAYIPVYAHLKTRNLETVKIPEKPAILKHQGTMRAVTVAITKLKKAMTMAKKRNLTRSQMQT